MENPVLICKERYRSIFKNIHQHKQQFTNVEYRPRKKVQPCTNTGEIFSKSAGVVTASITMFQLIERKDAKTQPVMFSHFCRVW